MKIGIDLDGVVIDSETTDWKIIKRLADNEVKTLYFRDTNLMKLEENQYIKEVNNWGEIYRYIKCNKT